MSKEYGYFKQLNIGMDHYTSIDKWENYFTCFVQIMISPLILGLIRNALFTNNWETFTLINVDF